MLEEQNHFHFFLFKMNQLKLKSDILVFECIQLVTFFSLFILSTFIYKILDWNVIFLKNKASN